MLGIASHSVPYLGPLHALNAFAILVVAIQAGRLVGARVQEREPALVQ